MQCRRFWLAAVVQAALELSWGPCAGAKHPQWMWLGNLPWPGISGCLVRLRWCVALGFCCMREEQQEPLQALATSLVVMEA